MSKQDVPPPALDDPALDRMGHALLTMAKHMWTLHDRQRMLESQLLKAGVSIDVDAAPDAELSDTLDAERDQFVAALLQAMTGESKD